MAAALRRNRNQNRAADLGAHYYSTHYGKHDYGLMTAHSAVIGEIVYFGASTFEPQQAVEQPGSLVLAEAGLES